MDEPHIICYLAFPAGGNEKLIIPLGHMRHHNAQGNLFCSEQKNISSEIFGATSTSLLSNVDPLNKMLVPNPGL